MDVRVGPRFVWDEEAGPSVRFHRQGGSDASWRRTGAPCRDSGFTTAEGPTTSQTTFHSGWCGFKKESGLSWSETARCLGISPMTIRRCWWKAGIGPNYRHLNALLSLADDLDRGHLFRE